MIGGMSVVESPYARVGAPILACDPAVPAGPVTVFAHPLDVLRITQPELGPVERVMVLVDRVVDAAIRRVDA